jgi:hypothetical protein
VHELRVGVVHGSGREHVLFVRGRKVCGSGFQRLHELCRRHFFCHHGRIKLRGVVKVHPADRYFKLFFFIFFLKKNIETPWTSLTRESL